MQRVCQFRKGHFCREKQRCEKAEGEPGKPSREGGKYFELGGKSGAHGANKTVSLIHLGGLRFADPHDLTRTFLKACAWRIPLITRDLVGETPKLTPTCLVINLPLSVLLFSSVVHAVQ